MLWIALALIVIVLSVLVIVLVQFQRQNAKLLSELEDQGAQHEQEAKKWSSFVSGLKARIERLSRYKGIADADDKASEMLRAARLTVQKANEDANAILSQAQQQAAKLEAEGKRVFDSASLHAQGIESAANKRAAEMASAAEQAARQEVKELRDHAKALLDSATVQAARIIDRANKRAEEIAGSAYDAMKNVALLDQTAKALKNRIEGYGNEYLVAGRSLLDDLALEFGYTQAGEDLKNARDWSRRMIQNGTAATCNYAEPVRREAANAFVIDAFNGKVDSVLSRVKHDNAGTLEQEIRDAYALVNFNGRAFRDARITEEYLAAKLDELKWACVVQELKVQEREEQRHIKEQIREEEKARKEYERAMRDAAAQEEMLRKAMEKARLLAETATAEQKAEYEQQLGELSQRLKEAEERNQRAQSMAQQTRKGHVYIISNVGSFGEDVYKVGLTRRLEPLERVRELGDSSVPFEYDVHALILSDDAPALETTLHKQFVLNQLNKVNHRKEFFKVALKDIRDVVDKMGLTVKWTMAADARDYRDSLAIEKLIREDPTAREAWVKRQLDLDPVGINAAGPEEHQLESATLAVEE